MSRRSRPARYWGSEPPTSSAGTRHPAHGQAVGREVGYDAEDPGKRLERRAQGPERRRRVSRSSGYTCTMSTVALGEVKDRLSEYIASVERTHDRVMITRHGRPAAVLISPEDLAALEETIDVLTTSGAREAIAEGLADLAAGRVADNEALRVRFAPR